MLLPTPTSWESPAQDLDRDNAVTMETISEGNLDLAIMLAVKMVRLRMFQNPVLALFFKSTVSQILTPHTFSINIKEKAGDTSNTLLWNLLPGPSVPKTHSYLLRNCIHRTFRFGDCMIKISLSLLSIQMPLTFLKPFTAPSSSSSVWHFRVLPMEPFRSCKLPLPNSNTLPPISGTC